MKRHLAAGALAVGIVVAGGVGVVLLQTPTTTAEGTRIAGVPAAGLTREALERRVQGLVDALPQTLPVTAGTREVDLGRDDLGVAVDVGATVDKALKESGTRSLFGLVKFGGGKPIGLVLAVDERRLDQTVTRVVKQALVEDFDGDLRWNGSRFLVKPPTPGQSATSREVQAVLTAAVQTLATKAEVTVVQQPAGVALSDLQALAATAQTAVQPLRLVAADLTATVPVGVLGPQITFKQGTPLQLALREPGATKLAHRLATSLSRPVQEPRFTVPSTVGLLSEKGNVNWHPRPATVRLSKPARTGLAVTPASVTAALAASLRQAQATATLHPTVVQPALSASLAGRVNSLLGTFTTHFVCCEPRVHNIRLIASTIDGTVIAPGKTFSLNGIVGQRTRAKGYVEAPFILEGKHDLDIGGGVSQFATTMYNAAFFAGVRLDSHKAHSFYLSRYPPGREATVNFPTIDLTWTNDTGVPVVIDATTTGTSVTVSLYGDNGGRSVSAVAGPREPVAGQDFRIIITRTVTSVGGQARVEHIKTLYAKAPPD